MRSILSLTCMNLHLSANSKQVWSAIRIMHCSRNDKCRQDSASVLGGAYFHAVTGYERNKTVL